jgi:translation initiation factor 2 subunit 3
MSDNINQEYSEYMENQPVINIGMIGHVSDGKSTIIKSLTGIVTQKHSHEKIKNITMRLGYANAKICKCNTCKSPECYSSFKSSETKYICKHCSNIMTLINHISFVDCPGHNQLLSTMINGTSIMDYTLLVESVANKQIPAPQTLEHINLINKLKIKNIATIINKIDLCKPERIYECITELNKFNITENIIPLSATFNINVDILCELLGNLPVPKRIIKDDDFKMIIIRSFNVNLPNTKISELRGGVVGGSLIKGNVKLGDELFILPGLIINNKYKPIKCKVLDINSDTNKLTHAISGGLLGIMLDIDPGISTDNKLSGNVLIKKKQRYYNITNNFNIIINETFKITENRYIVNIHSNNISCIIKMIDNVNKIINVQIDRPTYIDSNDRIIISEETINGLHIVSYGNLISCIDYESV